MRPRGPAASLKQGVDHGLRYQADALFCPTEPFCVQDRVLPDDQAFRYVHIAVENHLTVPFSADFESGINEDKRWDEGVDTLAQIKKLVTDIDHPNLGVCLAPPHLWVMNDSISEAIIFLAERKRLYYYYIWDIDRAYRHGVDGLNFGPGEMQLPRVDGTLDHAVPLSTLKRIGYQGAASL